MSLVVRFGNQPSVLPPTIVELTDTLVNDAAPVVAESSVEPEEQPITAFVCVIDYVGDSRLITCRRYDVIGEHGHVGAICSTANGYRQFRTDRIKSVADAYTGEILGDGSYFARFAPTTVRSVKPTWGLPRMRASKLVAGLNVLAFMAHCDGKWHPLETEPVERFICSLWLRKEWEGEPPLDELVAHARRLAPDADTFFRSLNYYADSETSTTILKRAVNDLIAADGVICINEMNWSTELAEYMAQRRLRYSESTLREARVGTDR